jgi:hypothetical protein
VDALDVRTLLQTPTVAHEVGHFLFGSREHAPTGLMRASHRLDYLMQSGYPMFDVVARRPRVDPMRRPVVRRTAELKADVVNADGIGAF